MRTDRKILCFTEYEKALVHIGFKAIKKEIEELKVKILNESSDNPFLKKLSKVTE